MNMDFFQPFSHTTYSVGVIYCVVLNLPRELRYKTENVIVISVIPGPHEPKLNINTYLKPLVDELQELYKGVVLPCSSGILKQRHVRACVVCLAADIPASRKMCGFLAHSARLGCNKCYKSSISDHATYIHSRALFIDFVYTRNTMLELRVQYVNSQQKACSHDFAEGS